MINNKINDALNDQMNFELYSAYLYLSMAYYFNSINLHGFSHWIKIQSQEEIKHAMKIYNFMCDKHFQIKFGNISNPTITWTSPINAIQNVLDHEKIVTKRINLIMDIAIDNKDYTTQSFLKWFIDEQLEEENTIEIIMQKLSIVSDNKGMILYLDAEMNKRSE